MKCKFSERYGRRSSKKDFAKDGDLLSTTTNARKMLLSSLVLISTLTFADSIRVPGRRPSVVASALPLTELQTLLSPLQHATLFKPNSKIVRDGDVSEPCMNDLVQVMDDLRARRPSAVHMIDAFGKVPSGLARGHLQWLGSYDECLGVINGSVNYCLTRLGSSDNLAAIRESPALGTCLPRTCGKNDIESIVDSLVQFINRSSPYPIPELANLRARKTVCDFNKPWEVGAYVIITIIAVIVVICAFGTIVECCPVVTRYVRRRSTLSRSIGSEEPEDEPLLSGEVIVQSEASDMVVPDHVSSRTERWFESSSFAASWRHFTENRSDELPYLNGMRVATIWWVVIGKQFSLGEFAYENALDYYDGMKTFLGQLIANSNLAADTFFILSGLVLTYTILLKLERRDGKVNWVWLYVRRFLRLTPMYIVLLLIYVYLVPHLVTGPFTLLVGQDLGGDPLDVCKDYWWTNMLYINNFIPTDISQQCMDWTWFLAVEMQLFLLTPAIVFLLYKRPKVGLATIISLIGGCLITNAIIESQWGLPIAMFQVPLNTTTNNTYDANFDYVFDKPYTRASPYLLGMLLGFLFLKKPVWKFPYPKLDLVFNLGCWIASCVVANRVIFGLYDDAYDSPTSVDMLGRVSWQMLSRFGFSVAVCWVIFACQYGYAGPVRDILEWRMWRPLSRLTYIVYLFHPLTLQLWLVSQRDPFYYNAFNMGSLFFGQLVSVYALSFVFAVLIEFPLLRLERVALNY